MHVLYIVLELATLLRRGFVRSWEDRPRTALAITLACATVVLWLCWTAVMSICWPPPRHAWGSVHGKVTSVTGEPVSGVTVLFIDEAAGVGASGRTDDRGNYRAFGIQAGRYAVAVQPVPDADDHEPTREEELAAKSRLEPSVPARFQDTASSGLTAELRRGRNRYDVDLRDGR